MPSAAAAVAMTAVSAIYGGITAAESASYRAQVARNNAQTARNNAVYAAGASSARTEDAGMRAAARVADVGAAQAANGIDINTGSAADVSTGQRQLGMRDVERTAQQGALQTYGYKTQATGYEAQARADKAEIGPDIIGGFMKAGSAVAGNAGSLGFGESSGFNPGNISGDTNSALDSYIAGGNSLLSSSPSVPMQYQWMNSNNLATQGWDD